MYDFTKAKDLVKWAKEQYQKPNRYKGGGIGRYDKDGTRQFDCCGLFKCFMWHDYSTNNARYYGKTQKDYNCEGLIAEAKEKGKIDTIPEIEGVLVYQKGHMGIYIGNGQVIESTAKRYDGKKGKIYKTYFKGDGKGCDGKRTTWTNWFKSPYLTYEVEPTPEPTPEPKPEYPKEHIVKRGETLSAIADKYYGNGDMLHYMFIARNNNIKNPNKISTGQKLIIPKYSNKVTPNKIYVVKRGDYLIKNG